MLRPRFYFLSWLIIFYHSLTGSGVKQSSCFPFFLKLLLEVFVCEIILVFFQSDACAMDLKVILMLVSDFIFFLNFDLLLSFKCSNIIDFRFAYCFLNSFKFVASTVSSQWAGMEERLGEATPLPVKAAESVVSQVSFYLYFLL